MRVCMPSESVTNWYHQKVVTERRQAVIQDDITPGHSWYETECWAVAIISNDVKDSEPWHNTGYTRTILPSMPGGT